MASAQATLTAQKSRRTLQRHKGKRLQVIEKGKSQERLEPQQQLRRSKRLNEIQQGQKACLPKERRPSISTTNKTNHEKEFSTSAQQHSRKRSQNINPVDRVPEEPPRKRARGLPTHLTSSIDKRSYIEWWTEDMQPESPSMLRRQIAAASLHRKRSEGSLAQPESAVSSDQISNPYSNPRFPLVFEKMGSFMGEYEGENEAEIKKREADLRQTLRQKPQPVTVPENSPFGNELFQPFMRALRNRNEAKIIQDIGRLIVPSAQLLALRDPKRFGHLTESVNEPWGSCVPWIKPRPQPDYSVGFSESAFSDEQVKKLSLLCGGLEDESLFRATFYMYLPFLTVEVKRGAVGISVAENQNTHSMSIAVKGVVKLFRLVGREKELDGRWLGFQFAHDHQTVKIYANYPITTGSKTVIHREMIESIDLEAHEGKDRWTGNGITMIIYEHSRWHLEMIRSILDQWSPAGAISESLGLSQQLEGHYLLEDNDSALLTGENLDTQQTTPATSITQTEPTKRKRRRP